jgi:membrane dipeptidase
MVTFDYTAGTPWIVDDAVREAIDEADAAGESVREAVRRASVRAFRDDPDYRERFRAAYAAAGVDVASVTVSAGPTGAVGDWSARFDAADWLAKVTDPADARALGESEVGIVLNTQNLGAAMADLDDVEALFNAGVRVFQPTYNPANELGSGCYARTDCALSELGVAAVERVQSLGGVVDLSHCGRATTLDAVDVTDRPVAFTHVGCAAVGDHPRGKSDAELEALAADDGYVGIVGVPWFLAPDAESYDLDVFVDHLDHAIDVVGPDRVGVGTDFTHVDASAPARYLADARAHAVDAGFPEGYGEGYGGGFGEFRRYQDWPVLRERLEARYDDGVVRGVLGENFLSFWERATA